MARPSGQQRQLTLTEELEKLEQSITLTLQEIDHNFSRAHRIVTTSILPIVEQYAAHSKDVWDGAKFWKQFFESSANVSLSGYEEPSTQIEATEETMTEESNAITHTTLETSQDYETPSAQHISTDSIQDLDLSNLTISPSHSTPRPTAKQRQEMATFADYPSPYEALKQEINNTTVNATALSQMTDPQTPGKQSTLMADIAMTPQSSPFLPPLPKSTARPTSSRKKTDPLLHRVLDKNYRVQATPLTVNRYTSASDRTKAIDTPAASRRTRTALLESTLSSSPEVAPPQLHAEIFSSPQRKPRTPGVSVLTPARNKQNPIETRQQLPARTPGVWDSDGEDEDFDSDLAFGQSPPKTMQFHIPQSKLLRTPAQEASKRMVNDILQTAGISNSYRNGGGFNNYDNDDDDEIQLDLTPDQLEHGIEIDTRPFEMDENSPSIVRRAVNLEDETF